MEKGNQSYNYGCFLERVFEPAANGRLLDICYTAVEVMSHLGVASIYNSLIINEGNLCLWC